MKKNQIHAVLLALKTIRMPMIEDKDIRAALIKIHFFLLGQSKKLDADMDDIRAVHLGAYEDELRAVYELAARMVAESDQDKKNALYEEINGHTELLAAMNAFNKANTEKGEEAIELPCLINGEKFVEEYSNKQDYDPSVVEALYPLFDIG